MTTKTPIEIMHQLRDAMHKLRFGAPVTHVYNPLDYAGAMHQAYLERFAAHTPREVLLVGMNPGPWGMAQTGVPFGDVHFVRDWLQITPPPGTHIGKPAHEHPKRPIEGLGCARNEVSGSRLWGWARARYTTPDHFFQRFFVHNYCPLVFMEDSGRNRTPNRLSPQERASIYAPCDQALRDTIEYFQPKFAVGIGNFAQQRIQAALGQDIERFKAVRVGRILHPSPASPKANLGWAEQAEAELMELGVEL